MHYRSRYTKQSFFDTLIDMCDEHDLPFTPVYFSTYFYTAEVDIRARVILINERRTEEKNEVKIEDITRQEQEAILEGVTMLVGL